MSQLLIFWICAGIFFAILEMFTVTLYGISISIAAFVVAVYVWLTGEANVTVAQAIVLVIVSAGFSYYLPKKYSNAIEQRSDNPIDKEAGKLFVLHEAKGVFKINIEGVDYLVNESCVTPDFADGKKVVLETHTGSQVIVRIFSA